METLTAICRSDEYGVVPIIAKSRHNWVSGRENPIGKATVTWRLPVSL